MSNKAAIYTHQCLAGAGFAVIDSQIAWRLRPDLFASGQDCAITIYKRVLVEGAKLFTVKIAGIGPVKVLARSERNLAQRIEDVIGITVEEITPYEAPAVPEPVRGYGTAEHERKQRLIKLHNLAAQEPPSHGCVRRQEILAARAELARLDADSKPTEQEPEGDPKGDTAETATDRAKELILDLLEGGPTEAANVMAMADDEGISERTMQRAAEALGVVKSKAGFDGGWVWALPEAEAAA